MKRKYDVIIAGSMLSHPVPPGPYRSDPLAQTWTRGIFRGWTLRSLESDFLSISLLADEHRTPSMKGDMV